MADLADKAEALEQRVRDEALARSREQLPHGASRSNCMHCGNPIPSARRHALPGVERCAPCQQLLERQERRSSW
ncbi:MAG: TraR/DksA C4-type zinc finger protein [Burkholderiales bacterium]|nr:TraR/DksA C4-type zinc finger protein [Burkholderiales bacterium]